MTDVGTSITVGPFFGPGIPRAVIVGTLEHEAGVRHMADQLREVRANFPTQCDSYLTRRRQLQSGCLSLAFSIVLLFAGWSVVSMGRALLSRTIGVVVAGLNMLFQLAWMAHLPFSFFTMIMIAAC